MASKLYLFNPEHDMALANFTPYYQPPQEIVRMGEDLSYLPLWYACPGEEVMVADRELAGRYLHECSVSGLSPSGVYATGQKTGLELSPWGWDPAVVHRLQERGVAVDNWPDASALERIRYLSGRQRCVDVLSQMQPVAGCCGRAVVCSSLDEVHEFVDAVGETVLKSLWSGSGRGLLRVSPQTWSTNVEGWVARVIRTQGGIMGEPLYNKVCDFAMEYRADGRGNVTWVGYSLFETDSHGNYKLNRLLPDEQIVQTLAGYVASETLQAVRLLLQDVLQKMIGTDYAGYLGVDMMICREGENFLVHPCVEINLRMNMGVVARLFYDRYVAFPACGRYVVEHYMTDGEALKKHQELQMFFPVILSDQGWIAGGYVSLTPVGETTRYQVYVILDT